MTELTLKSLLIAFAIILAGCATNGGGEITGDFDEGDEIPSRPGILETLGGKELAIEF